ncbi:MAG: hypothetical protein KGN84_09985, partial [Acidobacteriota bacterium]|nr:hypothetical protein [Acidobacteriota bacterium]
GPDSVSGGTLVAKVVSRTPADMTLLAGQAAGLREEIKQQRQRDRAQLFQEGLRSRLTADGKLKINDDVIKRIVANYQKS